MRELQALILIFVFYINCFKPVVGAGCQIDIKSLPANTPLLLTRSRQILFPELGTSLIRLKPNEKIELDCPGSGKIQAGSVTLRGIAEATCSSGTIFEISGSAIDIKILLCSRRIASIAVGTSNTCWGKGTEIEVGLQLSDGHFLRQYKSCFDSALRTVLYSHHSLSWNVEENRVTKGFNSYSWSEGSFYKLRQKVNNIYPIATHRKTINRQVGLPDNDFKYVKETGHFFLAKGHLTPRVDFMYNGQQMSTFHYINSAPQWQTFNKNNWFYFEKDLRVYASRHSVDLEIYTGTYGISTLPHERTGNDVELYFYTGTDGNKMPIPALFWKVAYDPKNQAGIAVLGVNNPFRTNVLTSIICNDVANQLTWWTFDRSKIEYGYIYACTINDFRKAVPQFPALNAPNILN